jgi:hypothetical protein
MDTIAKRIRYVLWGNTKANLWYGLDFLMIILHTTIKIRICISLSLFLGKNVLINQKPLGLLFFAKITGKPK